MIPSLNLLPPQKKREHERIKALLLAHEIILFLFITLVLGAVTLLSARLILEQRYREAILEVVPGSSKIIRINRDIRSLNQELTLLATITRPALFWTPFLTSLTKQTPPGIALQSMTLNNESGFHLSGNAATRDDLIAFKTLLEHSPAVRTVDLPLQYLVEEHDIHFMVQATLDPKKL